MQEEVQQVLMSESLAPVGLEFAFVGTATRGTDTFRVYDETKILEKLVEQDGMSPAEAIEYFDFNIAGAWVGEHTAAFIRLNEGESAFGCGGTHG